MLVHQDILPNKLIFQTGYSAATNEIQYFANKNRHEAHMH